jgi:heme-degrading monooxygenase HmoA
MYIVIWEYQVKAEHSAKFEKIYSDKGAWVALFKNGSGYLGTELLRDSAHADRYMTIDRWVSRADYESFLSNWRKQYETLDAQCENLIEREALSGQWESISPQTR